MNIYNYNNILSMSALFYIRYEDITNQIVDYYKSKQLEIYEFSKGNSHFDFCLFNMSDVKKEVAVRRIFSVLLYAEKDAETGAFIKGIIEQLAKYEPLLIFTMRQDKQRFSSYITQGKIVPHSLMCTCFYYYIKFVNNKDLDFDEFIDDVSIRAQRFINVELPDPNKINLADWTPRIGHYRRAFDSIDTLRQLYCLMDKSIATPTAEQKEIFESSDKEIKENIRATNLILRQCINICNFNGISLVEYFNDVQFTSEDKKLLTKILSVSGKGYEDYITYADYTLGMILYCVIKSLQARRKFYFENYAEDEILRYKQLQQEISELKLQLEQSKEKENSLISENKALQSELKEKQNSIESLKSQNDRDTKVVSAPYEKRIAELERENKKLKETVNELNRTLNGETFELSRLRDLAFSLDEDNSNYTVAQSLDSLIKNKKVVLIGGHINLQNKLHADVPELTIIDGHDTGFDTNLIYNADFVVLYTGNMGHAVYYKVIQILREHNKPFAYMRSITNVEEIKNNLRLILGDANNR